jgi:hypothetical protein
MSILLTALLGFVGGPSGCSKRLQASFGWASAKGAKKNVASLSQAEN